MFVSSISYDNDHILTNLCYCEAELALTYCWSDLTNIDSWQMSWCLLAATHHADSIVTFM